MYKKPVFLFSCILFGCMAMSFNHGKNKRARVHAPKGVFLAHSSRANIDGKLYILYLSQKEMQALLSSSSGCKKDDKVIFQFFYGKNDTLDLDAWPTKHRAFPDKTDMLLHVTTLSCADMKGDNVHLGNVRLGRDEYKALKAVTTQYLFFIFVPVVTPLGNTGKYYIVYDIYGDNSLPTVCPYPAPAVTTKEPITTTRNPSPPYHG
jgi:hypothetical protein